MSQDKLMMNRLFAICSMVVAVTLLCVPASIAADIQVAVSSDEAYVGFPITLQVRIDNASKHDPPVIDPVDGLEIQSMGAPSFSSFIGPGSSRTSSTYQWLVTPLREGTFTIPPIRVKADGISSITKVVRITATKSDAGDLLIAEVESRQDKVYVGEPIELSLKIYVKAYVNKEENIKLSDSTMWSFLSEQTQWGVFAEAIEQMTQNRMQPRGIEVIREDADGEDATYYRYQIDATLFPSRPGSVDLDGVKICFTYPMEIGQSKSRRGGRSSFESMLGDDLLFPGSLFGDSFFGGPRTTRQITKSMPLMVEPELDSIVAKQIPSKGQPKEFAGAVGRYVIETNASNTKVQAGDPVELTIRVRGTGQMETVAAPPLSLIDDLTDKFKVTDQPLAGQVDRNQKIFTTTIRPIDETVTEIPAIPFTYFDPDSGEYETSYSDPIAITVTPAEVLKLDRIARTAPATAEAKDSESKTRVQIDQPALNLAWRDTTLSKDSTGVSLINVIVPAIAFPPVVFLIGLLMRGFVGINRRSASEAKTLEKIKSADRSSEMSDAMNHYLARRWKVPTLDTADADPSTDRILGHLRSIGLHRYAVRVEQWMDQANRSRLTSESELESLRQSAMELVRDAKSQRKIPSSISATALFCFVAIVAGSPNVHASDSLTDSRAIVEQAESAYRDGDFVGSANLLKSIDSDQFKSSDVLVNLGNAWWQSGDTTMSKARSKASYLRALNVDPTDDIARANLLAIDGSNWLFQKVTSLPMRSVLIVAIAAWSALWLTLAIRLWTSAFPWRSIAACCLLVALFAGCVAALQFSAVWFPHHAVIVADEVQLRSGDGESFDIVQTIASASGQVVRWNATRPGWVEVTAKDGIQGWLPANKVEIISR
ncbi:BatD family protein [Rubripirellula obstinata]|nr:BatD family protein [Rubripirellula obstinata]